MTFQATPKPNLGAALGRGVGQGIEDWSNRNLISRDMQRLKQQSQNASPLEQAWLMAEAAALNPQLARAVGPLSQSLMSNQKANSYMADNSGGLSSQGNAPSQAIQQAITRPSSQGQTGPEGVLSPTDQASKFFPSNKGSNEAPGNAPQESTRGEVKPILTGEEFIGAVQNQLRKMQAVSPHASWEDAERVIDRKNTENKLYNDQVEAERKNRIAEQEAFGQLGEEAFTKLYPDASDEIKAHARKVGEGFSGQNKSQADIRRAIAKEATKFKHTLSNIEGSLNAPRIQNLLQRKVAGNERSLKQAEDDARIQVQPLIKEGLYDLAREVTGKAGFYPEERENIVFGQIKPEIKKTISSIPKASLEDTATRGTPGSPAFGLKIKGEKIYTPESQEALKNNIISLWDGKQVNDDLNLLQMRKQYEDKGYDWRILKDTMNQLYLDGNIDFNDDQKNQFDSYMVEPPLTLLEGIFKTLGLRGR